jgi:hypothetical protein
VYRTLSMSLDFSRLVEHLDDFSGGGQRAAATSALFDVAQEVFGSEFAATWGWEVPVQANRGGPDPVRAGVDNASIIRVSNDSDLAAITRILERTTLYADFCALVVSGSLDLSSASYSNQGEVTVWSPDFADELLMANLLHADLVAEGRCVILPASSRLMWGSVSSEGEFRADAPVHQRLESAAFLPFNARRVDPSTRLDDAVVVYKQLVLPHFPGADLHMLAAIAESETEAFKNFNVWLRRALSRMPKLTGEADVRDLLDEMDEQMHRLTDEARRLSRLRSLRDLDVAVFAVSLGIVTQAPRAANLFGLLGGAGLLDLLRSSVERQGAKRNLRLDGFLVPWLLQPKAEDDPA